MTVTSRRKAPAALVLADGTVLYRPRPGAPGDVVGELVFNTAMTGYQEILTDPSYAGQLITFTFPHIGNVGTNAEDLEALTCHARGLVLRAPITEPANYRAAAASRPLARAAGPGRASPGSTPADSRGGCAMPAPRQPPWASTRTGIRTSTGYRDGARLAGPRWAWTLPRRSPASSATSGTNPSGTTRDGYRQLDSRPASCGRRRLWNQAQHPALARLARPAGDGRAGDDPGGRHPGAGAGRRLPLERARRPGGDRQVRGAADPGAAGVGQADLRHLPRPSDARPGARRAPPRR